MFESAGTLYISAASIGNDKVVIGYQDSGNSSFGTAIVGTVSGTSISFGTPVVFESAEANYVSAASISNDKVVIAYRDAGNSSFGTAVVISISSDLQDSVGIAQETGTVGQSKSVMLLGGISTVHSGLTPGQVQYLQADGTIGISGSNYPIGRALSATEILITKTPKGDRSDSGVDLAELFPTLDFSLAPGEIIALDPDNPVFVKRADGSNGERLIGIVSINPGLLFGEEEYENEITVPVALSGRVLTKVSTENDEIAIGDRITISSVVGVGMKANNSDKSVGYALDNYNSEDIGMIEVFIQLESGITVRDTLFEGIVTVQDYLFEGNVTVRGHVTFNQDTVGQAKILAGDTSVAVVFIEEYEFQPIVTITPRENWNGTHWVSDELTTGFSINIDPDQSDDITFNWHAFGGDGVKIYVSDGLTLPLTTDGTTEDIEIVVIEPELVSEPESLSEMPGTSSDVDQLPAGEPPAEESVVEESLTEELTEEQSVEGEPIEEPPVAEELSVEEPIIEESLVSEEPIIGEPSTEEPSVPEVPVEEELPVEEPVAEPSQVQQNPDESLGAGQVEE